MESTLAPECISVISVEVIATKFLMSLDPASMLLADCGALTSRWRQTMAHREPPRANSMASNDPISDYMQRHGCGFPDALEALAAQLGPPTARGIRRALQTLGRAGAPVDLLEALEAWNDDQMRQAA
jgi:hypothetical protein